MNSDIAIEKLFNDIRADFSDLWTCQQRGSTTEIVTPYMDLHDDAIMVYLTKRGQRFIVSDGGRIDAIASEGDVDLSERKNLHYADMLEYYDIKQSYYDGQTFCFKSTDDVQMLSSLIYDIVHFHKAIVDSMFMESLFNDSEAKEKYFGTVVKDIIREKLLRNKIAREKYEMCQIDQLKGLQFNSFVRERKSGQIWSAMAIYSRDLRGLRNSVQRAQFAFDYVTRNQFEEIRLAAVVDEIPSSVSNRVEARAFISGINSWRQTYGLDKYSIREFERVQTMDSLFTLKSAS